MLASTMQFSTYEQHHTLQTHTHTTTGPNRARKPTQFADQARTTRNTTPNKRCGLSGPNSVPDTQPATTHPTFPPPHPHPHPRRSTRHEHDSCTSEAASHRKRASNPLTFHP